MPANLGNPAVATGLEKVSFHSNAKERKWQPNPVFLPGKSYGQKSLVGYTPWGHKELDMTEQLAHTHVLIYKLIELYTLNVYIAFYLCNCTHLTC